jgi:hypothetical protein
MSSLSSSSIGAIMVGVTAVAALSALVVNKSTTPMPQNQFLPEVQRNVPNRPNIIAPVPLAGPIAPLVPVGSPEVPIDAPVAGLAPVAGPVPVGAPVAPVAGPVPVGAPVAPVAGPEVPVAGLAPVAGPVPLGAPVGGPAVPESRQSSGLLNKISGLFRTKPGVAPVTSGVAPVTSDVAPVTSGVPIDSSVVASVTSGVVPIDSGVVPVNTSNIPVPDANVPVPEPGVAPVEANVATVTVAPGDNVVASVDGAPEEPVDVTPAFHGTSTSADITPAFDEEGSGWGTHVPEPPRSMTYAPSEVPAGAPPTRGPTIYIKEEDLEGGTRRCAHCNRRKKRTKRNKKI